MSNTVGGFEEYYRQRTKKNRSLRSLILKSVSDKYSDLYNALYVLLHNAKKDSRYGRSVFNKSVFRDANALIVAFLKGYEKHLEKKCSLLASYSIRSAKADLAALKIKSSVDVKDFLATVDSYVDETMRYANAQKDRMLAQISSMLKNDGIRISRLASQKNISFKKAKEIYVGDSEFNLYFVDKLNRKKNMNWYFGVLTGSIMQHIELDSYIYAMITDGIDLVKILECDGDSGCSKYNGNIVSISGDSSEYVSMDSLLNSGEIWHPNCSHLITVAGV